MRYFLTIIFTIFTLSIYAQTNCEAEFNSDDVLRWRKQLNFNPKYMSPEFADYVIIKLSAKAYFQMHIDISVTCKRELEKQSKTQDMYYFWDKKIIESQINTFYPAYFIFYQLDKMAFVELKG